MLRTLFLLGTHGVALAAGFALGVYLLPILTAPPSPDAAALEAMSANAEFTATLTRDQPGSDFLHWGEGTISLGPDQIVHRGKLSPGPDYKLYLVPSFVEDESGFLAVKTDALVVGDVKTFDGFILDIPTSVDLTEYTTVLVWCEAFGEFITSAKFR